MNRYKPNKHCLLAMLVMILAAGCSSKTFPDKTIHIWNVAEWSITNPGVVDQSFDLIADVIFTHENGETRETQMFYDGGSTWKFRFCGTLTGEWQFSTSAEDSDLGGYQGTVVVIEDPDHDANGFITNFGNKWGWQGSGKAFVPQWVMGKEMEYFYDIEAGKIRTDLIEKDIQEFIHAHGFTGFHLQVMESWFDLTGEGPFIGPDIRTYQVLETIVGRVHAEGGACHIWMWGSDGNRENMDGNGPRGILGDPGNAMDLRNLRYLAARLGPLPGWTLGYGIDTENGTATVDQLNGWKDYLEEHMGWDHFIGARVAYDEKGLWALVPSGPRPPHDEKYCSEIKDEHCSWLSGDYIGYTSYRPLYDRYLEALNHHPDKPSFEEDRFRLRNLDNWSYKDYNQELTRRGLWHSALAGGVANIWGNLLPDSDHGGSRSYTAGTIHIKLQIKTYADFFHKRFLVDMETFKTEDPVVLSLRTADMKNMIYYQEDTDVVRLDITGLSEALSAIAVDTRKEYKEIEIGDIDDSITRWEAPYVSDWAIALGNFEE